MWDFDFQWWHPPLWAAMMVAGWVIGATFDPVGRIIRWRHKRRGIEWPPRRRS